MYGLIAIGVITLALVGFGGIQTLNLRHCQQQSAKALAAHAVAIAEQNARVSEWEQKAKSVQARAAQAGKQAAEHAKIAKQRESAILGQPGPSKEADCTDRELATLELIRHYRSGK